MRYPLLQAINNSIKIRKCCSKLVQTFVASDQESSKWFPCENRDKAFNVSYCGPRSQIKANFCDHCTLQPRFLKSSLTQPKKPSIHVCAAEIVVSVIVFHKKILIKFLLVLNQMVNKEGFLPLWSNTILQERIVQNMLSYLSLLLQSVAQTNCLSS